MKTNNQCLQAFMELAADNSYHKATHPDTHHLQSFIFQEVLPTDPEDRIPHFMEFVTELATKFDNAARLHEDCQTIIQCIPEDAPDRKRMRHAIGKVALELRLLPPRV